jgi:hypothetical protein
VSSTRRSTRRSLMPNGRPYRPHSGAPRAPLFLCRYRPLGAQSVSRAEPLALRSPLSYGLDRSGPCLARGACPVRSGTFSAVSTLGGRGPCLTRQGPWRVGRVPRLTRQGPWRVIRGARCVSCCARCVRDRSRAVGRGPCGASRRVRRRRTGRGPKNAALAPRSGLKLYFR